MDDAVSPPCSPRCSVLACVAPARGHSLDHAFFGRSKEITRTLQLQRPADALRCARERSACLSQVEAIFTQRRLTLCASIDVGLWRMAVLFLPLLVVGNALWRIEVPVGHPPSEFVKRSPHRQRRWNRVRAGPRWIRDYGHGFRTFTVGDDDVTGGEPGRRSRGWRHGDRHGNFLVTRLIRFVPAPRPAS